MRNWISCLMVSGNTCRLEIARSSPVIANDLVSPPWLSALCKLLACQASVCTPYNGHRFIPTLSASVCWLKWRCHLKPRCQGRQQRLAPPQTAWQGLDATGTTQRAYRAFAGALGMGGSTVTAVTAHSGNLCPSMLGSVLQRPWRTFRRPLPLSASMQQSPGQRIDLPQGVALLRAKLSGLGIGPVA